MSIHPRLVAQFLALACAFLFAATAAARPNFVVIMVDDLDVDVWNAVLKLGVLPNIKTLLIDRGTTFEQVFNSQPLCCPSRATFHTGQYPQNHRIMGNDHGLPGNNEGYYDQYKSGQEKQALATWLKAPGSQPASQHESGAARPDHPAQARLNELKNCSETVCKQFEDN